MQNAWQAYLEMALGLTEVPRKRAQKVAGELLSKGGATAGQLQGLVGDLVTASASNREALTNLVRYEVDRALGRVGLATAEEVADLTARVKDLERELAAAQAGPDGAAAIDEQAKIAPVGQDEVASPAAPVKKTVAKKAVKKAAPAKKTALPPSIAPIPDVTPSDVAPARAKKTAKAAGTAPVKKAPGTRVAKKAVPPLDLPEGTL
ncbi:phasin family protein [Symbioplanes lichenis]|uniref:phasin family protein n=1 Tax=Symbioplanes lichenis TaxID=1629072 RepID=UPI002738DB02|nr:hypothetical protein [Actinoplanes lichenis]